MDLKELETFIKVAELKSFSKTAIELSVTQPTITNHIQSLEKELDTRLINRKGRNISLTDSGKILYRYAIDIINSCKMARTELVEEAGEVVGHLTIQSSAVPRRYILPNLISEFIKEHKNVTFTIANDDNINTIVQINNRQLDFAIVDFKTNDSSIDFTKIMTEELYLVVPNSAANENYSYVDKEILLNHKMLLKENTDEIKDRVIKECEAIGISGEDIKIGGYSTDLETIKSLIALGAGIAILTERDIYDDVKAGRFKAVRIEGANFQKSFYLASPNDRYLSPINEIFKKYMLEYFERNYN